MKKIKAPRRIVQPSLAAGQLWRMAEADLRVGIVGKSLVHYRLGEHDAVRVHTSCEHAASKDGQISDRKHDGNSHRVEQPCPPEATRQQGKDDQLSGNAKQQHRHRKDGLLRH